MNIRPVAHAKRSMRRWLVKCRLGAPLMGRALFAVLVAVLAATLPTLALASPPDPAWIPGIYDDADYDDVVALAASGIADTAIGAPVDVAPVLVRTGSPLQALDSTPRPVAFSPIRPRAPPPPGGR